jgi:two-component system cell cycle response regulator DivK
VAKRILVVEDDLLNRMFFSATLEASGFDVRMVTDGAQVMDATKDFAPDLITMDINLPNVSGVDLIKRLRTSSKFKAVPIIAITAYVGKGEEARIRKAGASDYMAKPISIKPFLASVERLLDGGPTVDTKGSSGRSVN